MLTVCFVFVICNQRFDVFRKPGIARPIRIILPRYMNSPLRVGALFFYALSQMLDTKVKFQRLPVVSFKQMYWTGTQ